MNVNTNQLVPMTDANQNFSKVARMVDEKGLAVIMKNNKPLFLQWLDMLLHLQNRRTRYR